MRSKRTRGAGLRGPEVRARFQMTSALPIKARSRGPCQQFHQLLGELGIEFGDEGLCFPETPETVPYGERQKMGHCTIGPSRITQFIPQEFSGVTEVNLLRQLIP